MKPKIRCEQVGGVQLDRRKQLSQVPAGGQTIGRESSSNYPRALYAIIYLMGSSTPSTDFNRRALVGAKAAKKDEFYTQYVDVQQEIEAYLELDNNTFRGKVVYCNCDDPFESNFFKYFAANFNRLGLKKLMATSYAGSPIAGTSSLFPEYELGIETHKRPGGLAIIVDHVSDEDEDGATTIKDVELFLKRNKAARISLTGNDRYSGGDFRSPECLKLLEQADIVATNPPFSLFREYVGQLIKFQKNFLIVGPKNAITYREIFPLIKRNELWLGKSFSNGNAFFYVPTESLRSYADGVYNPITGLVKFRNVGWFTNLDHGRRHEILDLMTLAENLRFSKHKEIRGKESYDRYDNYEAIEVPFTDAIPGDYEGVMGVPITFLDRYNPAQFEVIGLGASAGYNAAIVGLQKKPGFKDARPLIRGKNTYARVFIRKSQPAKKTQS